MTFRVSTRQQPTSSGLDGTLHVLEADGDRAEVWPADYILRITYRLQPGRLRVEAELTNPDTVSLPFGLGYHPYFSVPFLPGGKAEDCQIQVPARSFWVLQESLPTGERKPVDA